MRYALLILLLVPLVCLAGEKEDSAELNKLLKEIRAQLPATWRSDIRVQQRFEVRLELFIQTHTAVEVHEVGMNMPGRSADSPPERPKRELYEIRLIVCPYTSPEQYAKAKAKNLENHLRRVEFAKKNLAAVKYGYMGGEPYPPSAYQPENDRQRELVQQYAALWINTEPQRLPTHYRGTIAIELWDDPYSLVDPSLQTESVNISKTLDNLLTPYDPPKKD